MDNIIYGINPVLEAFNSENVTVDKIYILKTKRDSRIQKIINLAKRNNARIRFYDKNFFNRYKDYNHQGIIAEIVHFKYSEIDDILNKNFLVILDSITDIQNFGNIIRTCEFLGVDGIVIPKDKSATVNSKVVKTSSGAIFNIPVVKVVNLNNLIKNLKNNGFIIIGTSSGGNIELNDLKLTSDKVAVIIGNEEKGIRKSLIDKCDFIVRINRFGKTNSLNVVSATSIIIYKIRNELI